MLDRGRSIVLGALRGLAIVLRRPEALIFLPVLTLTGYWLWGEQALLILAFGLPVVFILTAPHADLLQQRQKAGLAPGNMAATMKWVTSFRPADGAQDAACLVIQMDDVEHFVERFGVGALAAAQSHLSERIRGRVRLEDVICNLGGGRIAIVLSFPRRVGLDPLARLALRIQGAIAAPVKIGTMPVYVTCSIGVAIASRLKDDSGMTLFEAAEQAAREASRRGPRGLRVWSPEIGSRSGTDGLQRSVLERALEEGQFQPHFQPQLLTDNGDLSGMEALARWHHPERGILLPADFLPAIEAYDLCGRLGEVILRKSLQALAEWDRDGLLIPSVSVNFSAAELRNPDLPNQIERELRRFGLKPERLTIEILETVIVEAENDMVIANVARLAAMGCGVDLDDFGTGHASIAAIRRFTVRRLKIDRTFVAHVDVDRDQQRMISAIVSLADRLGLVSLAEGVETQAEIAMLAQLGCSHVQGYGIARPMPAEDVAEWVTRHAARPNEVPRIGLQGI